MFEDLQHTVMVQGNECLGQPNAKEKHLHS